jgi:hypothetical protein
VPTAAALLDRLGNPGTVRLGTSAPVPARLSTGLPALDGALAGGLPRGRVTELAGPRSAGRTALACRIAASATKAEETIAWVDLEDALDPAAADAAGVALARTLWVRPRTPGDALRATEILLGAGGFGLVVLDQDDRGAPSGRAVSWIRLARAAERMGSTLLVLTTTPRVGSCAALGLELLGRQAHWSRGPGRLVLLDGITSRLAVTRSRSGGAGRALVLRHAGA